MSTAAHELDGPALIKAGRTMGNVAEFYGVFLQGRLIQGNDGPRRFETYIEADKHHAWLMTSPEATAGEMQQSVRRR